MIPQVIDSTTLRLVKAIVFVACLIPAAYYAHGLATDGLGANPIETVTRGFGTWALNFIAITLCVTPIRRFMGVSWILRLRRMLGLFAFFYAAMHLATYLWLDQFFDWTAIAKDILKRPFITVGMAAFILLVPLALTSNQVSIRRLGGRRWQQLHRAVYAIALLAVLHYFWMVKLDLRTPLLYGGAIMVLLGMRVWWRRQEWHRQRRTATTPRAVVRSAYPVIPLTLRK